MPDTTYQKGLDGESRAALYLQNRGMVLLQKRYRSPFGEIDLVMRDGDTLVFVEVKARANADAGTMLRVGWTRGTTEQGSSGSAIFVATTGGTRYVVGALHGGSASCANPQGTDYYGRFNRAFYRGLGDWLTQ